MLSAFEYQLELLKVELEHINSSIRQMDEITKSIKDWAIVTWTASLGVALATKSLNHFIGLTAIIPLIFWIVDAQYRNIQSRFIFRLEQISDFLNDARLKQSFNEKQLVNFQVMDPMAKKSRGNLLYEKQVSLSRTLRFRSVYYLYLGLMIISISVHLIFHKFVF